MSPVPGDLITLLTVVKIKSLINPGKSWAVLRHSGEFILNCRNTAFSMFYGNYSVINHLTDNKFPSKL